MKIALITGASRGLGKSIALHLAQQGVDSLLTYHAARNEADAVAAEIRQHGRRAAVLQLDTRNTASFTNFAQTVTTTLQQEWSTDRFDFLVNNAGTGLHTPFAQTTEDEFDDLYQVHLKGVFFLTQRLLPLLRDGGRIVNISSGLTRFSFPGSSAYAAVKGAVEVLTRYLARELGDRRIAVNTVAPGAVETDFRGGHVRDNPEINRMVAQNTALGRAGLPEDIGAAVAALLGDGGAWINGQRIEVAGGMML